MKVTNTASASVKHMSCGGCAVFMMLESQLMALKWANGMVLLEFDQERCTFRPVSAAGGARDWIPVFPGKMRKFLSIVTPWIAAQLVLCEVAGESSRQGLGVIKRLTSQERKWLDSISTQVFIRLVESDLTER
jgi:hypothetical protein